VEPIGRSAVTLLATTVCACLIGCSSAREGWGRGRYRVIEEAPKLQVRRSLQVLDPATGALDVAWIGVRIPEGGAEIQSCELTLFVDRDGDHRPDLDEVFDKRSSSTRTRKLLFDAVRVAPEHVGPLTRAWIDVRTSEETHDENWALVPD
jgi:hypothetical protein